MTKVVDAEAIHARVSAHRARRDARELDEVAPRKILLDLPELVLDDVAVVEEPLLGRQRFALRVTKIFGERRVGFSNPGAREDDAGSQWARSDPRGRDTVRAGDVDGVLDETLRRVNLTSERLRFVPSLGRQEAGAREARALRDTGLVLLGQELGQAHVRPLVAPSTR